MKEFFRYRKNLNFALVQGCYWTSNCTVFGFLVAYLENCGYSHIIIGLTATLIAVVCIIVQPIVGYICDTYLTSKKFLMASIILSVPIVLIIPFVSDNQILTMCLFIFLAVLDCSRSGAIDTWCVRLRDKYSEINYPVTRSVGSAGYGAFALVIGLFISKIGFDILFYSHVVFILLTLLFIAFLEGVPCENKVKKLNSDAQEHISFGKALKMLVKNKRYVIFIVSAFFFNIGARMIKSYFSTILIARGGDASHFGIAVFIASFFEFPIIMLFAQISKRIKLNKIFMMAMIIGFVRILSLNFLTDLWSAIILQILYAICFGLYLPMFLEYILRIVPSKICATALTIGNAVSASLGSILGNILGGIIIDKYGVNPFIVMNTVFIGISILIYSLSFIVKKDNLD